MAQPSVHGRFIWQELMTTDTEGASSFYRRLIGWRVQSPSHPSADYSVFATASGSVGGVMALSQEARQMGARPHWLPYMGAENVDDTVATAEALGGRVLRPAADIENLGRYAVLADPQGAAFGIYRPLHPADSSAKSRPERGEFSWQELATSDYEAAFRFYSDLFGWEVLHRMEMGPAGTYLVFGRDGVQHGGIYKLSAQMPAPYWLSYIEVTDVDALIEPARAGGGRIITGPMEVPGGGRIAQLLDPSGVLFALHTPAPSAHAREQVPAVHSADRPRRAAKKASAHRAPAKKAPARAAPARKAPARKAPAKKASAKKVAAKRAKRATAARPTAQRGRRGAAGTARGAKKAARRRSAAARARPRRR